MMNFLDPNAAMNPQQAREQSMQDILRGVSPYPMGNPAMGALQIAEREREEQTRKNPFFDRANRSGLIGIGADIYDKFRGR